MAVPTAWIGQDGNLYYGDGGEGSGVQNMGTWANNYEYVNGGIRSTNFDTSLGQGAGYMPGVTMIDDPATTRVLSDSTSSGGGGSGPAYDPADLAFLDDQDATLRRMLQSADSSLGSGLANISDSYNREQSGANARQSQALRDYGIRRDDTTRDQMKSLGGVDTHARTLADSIRRILGMASGSGSSAYKFAAPMAVARDASQKRSGVKETFGRNLRNIDTAEGDTKTQFEQLLEDLARQRNQKESELRGGILERQNSINSGLADVAGERARLLGGGYDQVRLAQQPYRDSINSKQSQLDNLFNQFRSPAYNVKPVDVKMPDMAQYTFDRTAVNANNQMGNSPNSPYAQFLMRKQQEDEERIV